jgi:hypothetical protein
MPFSDLLLSNANSCARQWPGHCIFFILAELFADCYFMKKIILNLLIGQISEYTVPF